MKPHEPIHRATLPRSGGRGLFQAAAAGYHLAAVLTLVLGAWTGLVHVGLLLAAGLVAVAAGVLRLRLGRRPREEPTSRLDKLDRNVSRWFWEEATPEQSADGAPAGTESLHGEADRIIGEIRIAARSISDLTRPEESSRHAAIWRRILGETDEIDALLLGYRLSITWHRFYRGSIDERLHNIVRLKLIDSLATARCSAYRRGELAPPTDTLRPGALRRAAFEAATLDLTFAEGDIETGVTNLTTGLSETFWTVYRQLALRRVEDPFDFDGCDPIVLKDVFRTDPRPVASRRIEIPLGVAG